MLALRVVLGTALAAILVAAVNGAVPTAADGAGAWSAIAGVTTLAGLGLLVVSVRDRRRLRALREEQVSLVADLESRFSRLASTDPETGLGNQVRLVEDLRGFAARLQRYGQTYSIAVLEIEGYDELGSRTGEAVRAAVLNAVASVVRRALRVADAPYRLAGDRIVCLFPATDAVSARIAVDRIATSVGMICVPHADGVEIPAISACIVDGTPDDLLLATALRSLGTWMAEGNRGVVVEGAAWRSTFDQRAG